MRTSGLLVLLVGIGCAPNAAAPPAAASSPGATDESGDEMTTEQLEVECERGARGACFLLAGRYKLGARGTPKDPAKSVHYHERSCDLGVTEGCVQLGYLYVKGFAGPPDPSRGFTLFADACDRQSANGCDSLGEAYEKGWGVPPDPQKAREAFAKACQLDPKLCR